MSYKDKLLEKNIAVVNNRLEKLLFKSELSINDKDFPKKFDEFFSPLMNTIKIIVEK